MKNSMRPKPAQLSVIAVAALAIVAVAAVMLLAGGNPAQATNAETRTLTPENSGGGHLLPMATDNTPTPTPRFPGEPPCPEQAVPVVDSGHIALFDVWWNPEELELTNTSCPPTVLHVPADPGDEEEERPATPARDDRSASSIDIEETVIHIPNSAKVTLNETDYPKDKYQAVWDADDAENPAGDGDRMVWVLPACPPDGSSDTVELCLSFSAALLNDADWNGPIVYHMDHVHQVDIDKQDQRYVLAYDVTNERSQLHWSSFDARVSRMPVTPGGYERPVWFFTSRGSYEFQVHITGDTNLDLSDSVNKNPSVNSDVRTYILHVGAEADLGVGVTVTPADSADTSIDPGDNVTITLTASNAGPDTAPGTKVEVNLPEGLTYSSHVAASGTSYDSGVWAINDLANGASKTLTITARVKEGTRGETLKVKATISATETLQIKELVENEQGEDEVTVVTYHVPVPDKVSGNNMAMDTVTVASSANVNPIFRVVRSINENSATGSRVGEPVVAHDPDDSALHYSLTGSDADKFDVNDQGQISVSWCGVPDYETQTSYNLKLNVSDWKDDNGNMQPEGERTIDHDTGVLVQVIDDPRPADWIDHPVPTIRVTHDASSSTVANEETVTFTAVPKNFTDCTTPVYSWWRQDPESPGWIKQVEEGGRTFSVAHLGPATWEYQARTTYRDDAGMIRITVSPPVSITWQGSGQ